VSQAKEQKGRECHDRDSRTENQRDTEDGQHLCVKVAILKAKVLMSSPRGRVIKVIALLQSQPGREIGQENVLHVKQIEG
jgi:hypothetical protein